MTSLLTNSAAMTALQTLQSTNKSLEMTQNRISTGLRVGEAKDNAAYWSIATTMRSDKSAGDAVQDSLGIGATLADVASNGVNQLKDTLTKIKDKIVSASQDGINKADVQLEITQLQADLASTIESSSFNGVNWLDGSAATATIVSSVTRSDTGVAINTIDVTLTDMTTTLTDTSAIDISAAADQAAMQTALDTVETALGAVTSYAANVGAVSSRIDLQQSFQAKLGDALDRGIGTLVDADMTEESTRLSALQTQQQLGVQALSIANSSSQSVLSLFRG